LAEKGAKLWLDSSSVNAAIVSVFRSGCDRYMKKRGMAGRQTGKESSSDEPAIKSHGDQNSAVNGLYKVSPVTLAKSVKNKAEIRGMKNSHLRYCFSILMILIVFLC
jgi:Xaa-Pro aminopeptidase